MAGFVDDGGDAARKLARDRALIKSKVVREDFKTGQKHNRMHGAPRLNDLDFEALKKHVNKPDYSYMDPDNANSNKVAIESLTNRFKIPAGMEMYRALGPIDLEQILQAQKEGKDWKPGVVRSTSGSGDLQSLGKSAMPRKLPNGNWDWVNFGGNNQYANTIAKIEAMEPLRGIQNVNRFGDLSVLNEENLLGPNTRYKLLESIPATPTTSGMMRFGAYANSFLGPLGFLPALDQAGKIWAGKTGGKPIAPAR
jgi:hypothetical protein